MEIFHDSHTGGDHVACIKAKEVDNLALLYCVATLPVVWDTLERKDWCIESFCNLGTPRQKEASLFLQGGCYLLISRDGRIVVAYTGSSGCVAHRFGDPAYNIDCKLMNETPESINVSYHACIERQREFEVIMLCNGPEENDSFRYIS